MAPPASRRSKQSSSSSPAPPIPLAGIALGLFAAIAAGFAASRLRRKRPVQSLQEEQPAAVSAGNPPAIPLLVQEREMEIKEIDDLKANSAILVNANGTIAIASHEPAKLAAGLKTVFDAFEEASLLQKNGAKSVEEGRQEEEDEEEEEEEEGVDEFQKKNGASTEAEAEKGGEDEGNEERESEAGVGEDEGGEDEGDEEKKTEALENGEEISGEEGETAEITVMIEASNIVDEASMEAQAPLVVDEASMEALESMALVEEEMEAATGGEEDEDDNGVVVVDEDTGDDGDYDRSSADQQPASPNGRMDFLEMMSDLQDDPDLLSSRSNSLSDAISESSIHEVSSAPVKPFVHAEEAMEASEEVMEASWTTATKPDFVGASNQLGHEEDFSESRNCSDVGKNLCRREEKLPEIEENLKPFEPDVVAGVVLDLNPVTVEIEEEDLSVDKVNRVEFKVISDVKGDNVALKGGILTESAGINGTVLSDDLPLPEELSESEAVDEGEHVLQDAKEGSDDTSGLVLTGEASAESVRSNGKVLSDDSQDNPSLSEIMTTDEPIRQLGQEMSNGTVFSIHGGELHLPVTEEMSVNCAHERLSYIECALVSQEWSLRPHSESTRGLVCLESNSSEEPLNADGILEELVLQSGGQDLDVVDGTSAVVSENSVNIIAQEQSSPLIASSKENTEGYELESDASTGGEGDTGSGRKDNDGLAGATQVEGTVHHAAKLEEIEEITRPDDANNFLFEFKKSAFPTDPVHAFNDNTREVDHMASKGPVHDVGLQAKGGFSSGVLKYLPLEIGLICLLIALVSYVLWYLEVSSPVP